MRQGQSLSRQTQLLLTFWRPLNRGNNNNNSTIGRGLLKQVTTEWWFYSQFFADRTVLRLLITGRSIRG